MNDLVTISGVISATADTVALGFTTRKFTLVGGAIVVVSLSTLELTILDAGGTISLISQTGIAVKKNATGWQFAAPNFSASLKI